MAVVGNVEGRVRELMASIGSLLQKGSTTTAEMRVLHGRLVFVEAQLFGRLAGAHMKQLSSFESMVGGTQIDEDLKRIDCFLDGPCSQW